ncbi:MULTISPECIES: patatin-like phospholipase family protein [unclassified Polaromonas]|uniref:patatin-like phospholipase family protein n=1 Tax=unclassified Polaromonas TaxID=2638319 RepID=UPI000F082C98|nr:MULTISPECIES: patatin-like phospholipase family protein [unclassified Polaromonas]AYQ27216.1 patatin family protein [Polaromonas sp. SP1]QGJ17944.1 patatin family protein [Polaromonas sp. Pch-P]
MTPAKRSKKKPSSHKPRIALALAGGGPLGAIYEIGALCALDETLRGLSFTGLDHYVGVSAGGFIAAGLANGMTPRELCAAFIENGDTASEVFDPAWLMVPAYGEFLRRGIMFPGLAASALWRATLGRKSLVNALEALGPALPTGIFSNDEVHTQLEKLFSKPGRTNDFRELRTRLTLVATNLDSGDAAPFGRPGWDHVPISKAVQASSALPGLFPPVEIDRHYYVDGALKKTMHAGVAMDDGIDLMFCLNPLVPFNSTRAPELAMDQRVMRRGLPREKQSIPRIVNGGLPAVLSQTFRSMIHSRLELGMKHYEKAYPDTDIVLLEPDHRDAEMFLANTFSYSQRRELAEHAYQKTRQMLRSRKTTLSARLARHGVSLNLDILEDPKRHLVAARPAATRVGRAIASLEDVMEDLSHAVKAASRHGHALPAAV